MEGLVTLIAAGAFAFGGYHFGRIQMGRDITNGKYRKNLPKSKPFSNRKLTGLLDKIGKQ